ncbi:hypothetical protein B0H17DRAFT_1146739 [Mycena rosella]|uniref:Uncharacterized protein n=1 Tax=Mycena rosella TaxID=1033263 RepID=A0AAD7CNY5_MYCRO|nr:hypothetical protein B0H17DRAFT_1146739 [Mycena rosella]
MYYAPEELSSSHMQMAAGACFRRRRLPTELLEDIFAMCAPPGADFVSGITTPQEDIDRLAKTYLLQLSRLRLALCARFSVSDFPSVIGTPMLWSTLVVDTVWWSEFPASSETESLRRNAAPKRRGSPAALSYFLWYISKVVIVARSLLLLPLVVDTVWWSEFPASSETLLGLVSISLERGVDFPLTVQITIQDGDPNERLLLELITRHARRWQRNTGWHASFPALPWGQLHDVKIENREFKSLHSEGSYSQVLSPEYILRHQDFLGQRISGNDPCVGYRADLHKLA